MCIDFTGPRPPGRVPPMRSVSLDMNVTTKGSPGQYPIMRNTTPYSLMQQQQQQQQQQGMIGNQGIMTNQANMAGKQHLATENMMFHKNVDTVSVGTGVLNRWSWTKG